MTIIEQLRQHQTELARCRQCENMIGPVVIGEAVDSRIFQLGQAPGIHEGEKGKPFAWTAGKTLFKWYQSIGVDEETFRASVHMAAVCRCFPGKHPKHGDRVPDREEIERCSAWLEKEVRLLKPQLMIPVGKLAIAQLMPVDKLKDVIGKQHRIRCYGADIDVIPLPHPSGASTWHRMEPGKTLLQEALGLIQAHPAWVDRFGCSRAEA